MSHFLEIYPDPSSDRITIKSSESQPQLNLSIVNLNGQECLNITLRDLSTQIDIRNLQNGIYFVKLKGDHIVQIGKIIKM